MAVPLRLPVLSVGDVFPRLERCDVNVVELLRQNSGWVFENPGKEPAPMGSRRPWGCACLLGRPWWVLPQGYCGKGSGQVPPSDFLEEVKGLIWSEV